LLKVVKVGKASGVTRTHLHQSHLLPHLNLVGGVETCKRESIHKNKHRSIEKLFTFAELVPNDLHARLMKSAKS
jgi:hypothetical protein